MKLVDVHAHLDSSSFEGDIDSVINRFRDAGGVSVLCSGVNPATNRRVLELSRRFDLIGCSFGLFPTDAIASELKTRDIEPFDVDVELEWIREHKVDCVCIGEIGLDYNDEEVRDSEELKEKQKIVFRKAISLAKELGKTIVIHTRKAEADCFEVLEACGYDRVVLHCFHGNKKLIKRGVMNGWSFSIPPNITRLQHFSMMAEIVPLGQILTETDAPYNAPVAGTRNEPAKVAVTIKEIARIKGISEEEVGKEIFKNFERLFR